MEQIKKQRLVVEKNRKSKNLSKNRHPHRSSGGELNG